MKSTKLFFIICFSLSYFSHFAQAQKSDSTAQAFESVATIFEQNIRPYLPDLAKMQTSDTTSKEAIQAQLLILEQKIKDFRKHSYKELIRNDGVRKNKDYFLGYFTQAYRTKFPELDKPYFEKCRDQVKALQ